MSATFKNAKKKLSQSELRRIMNEHKKDLKPVKKIESPLAKYNDQGQLTCVLCKSVVRSEAVWTVHINAKQHKQNVELAKKLKERTNNFTTPLKRPLTPPLPEVPEKKIKGILKNAIPVKSNAATVSGLQKSSENLETAELKSSKTGGNSLPEDFFDSKGKSLQKVAGASTKKEVEAEKVAQEEAPIENAEALPEGFFDDPKLDAKARHQEYKDPVEEEWEKFLKVIKEADTESAAIIAEDQEESTVERQIDEIDEQMKKLTKVLNLEKKKEELVTITNDLNKKNLSDEDDEDLGVEDLDEIFDWRSKKSFK